MSFYLGQHVVCVDDRPTILNGGCVTRKLLVKGQVYTVRNVGHWPSWCDGEGGTGVWLHEVVRDVDAVHGVETPFTVARFRPLDPKRLDVFRRALVSPKKPVEA